MARKSKKKGKDRKHHSSASPSTTITKEEVLQLIEAEFENPSPNHRPSWRKPLFKDWEIILGSKIYEVQRIFFVDGCGRSEFLSAQIERWSDSKDGNRTDLTHLLPKSTWDVWESVLDFAYGEDIEINDDIAMSMFLIARILQMRSLGISCVRYFKAILSDIKDCVRWDVKRTSDKILVGKDGKCARKDQDGWIGAAIAVCKDSVSSFTIEVTELHEYRSLMIGFVDSLMFKSQGGNYSTSGFFLNCNGGTLYSHHNEEARPYMKRNISVGEIIEAKYDASEGTISFSVGRPGNMTDFGVAFNVAKDVNYLRPCVEFFSRRPSAVKLNPFDKDEQLRSVITIAERGMQLMPDIESIFNVCVAFVANRFEEIELTRLASLKTDLLEAILSNDGLKCNSKSTRVGKVVRIHLEHVDEPVTKKTFDSLVKLVNNVEINDALPLLIKASEYDNRNFERKCLFTLKKGFGQMNDLSFLQKIPKHSLVMELFDSDDLCVKHEDYVFNAIIEYIKNGELSDEQVREVWATCRFAYLSGEKLLVAADVKDIPHEYVFRSFAYSKLQPKLKPSDIKHRYKQRKS